MAVVSIYSRMSHNRAFVQAMVKNRTTLWKKFRAIRLHILWARLFWTVCLGCSPADRNKCRRAGVEDDISMSSDNVLGYWTRTKCCISSRRVLKPCSFFVLHAFPLSPPIQCWKCCFEFFGEELRWAQASWQQRLQHWIWGPGGWVKVMQHFVLLLSIL